MVKLVEGNEKKIKLFWVNWTKDGGFFSSAISNSSFLNLKKIKFVHLKLGKELFENLVSLVKEQHLLAKKISSEKGIYGEVNLGDLKGGIYSLVRKWQNDSNVSLLDMISDLLYKLAVAHYFFNGNKRTALLTTGAFVYSLGYSLKDYANRKIYLQSWESLVLNVVIFHNKKSEIFIKNFIKSKLIANIIFRND